MTDSTSSLLITKLYIPRLRSSSHVSREALLAALDSGLDCKLILIAAAAGFGKTTLLADLSNRHPDAVCWFSLDEGDNSPVRFLLYLIAAIQTHCPQIGQELLAALQSPQPPPLENVLSILINQIAASGERLIIVLDDYHLIDNQAVHAMLTFLLEHLPPQVTLVLLSRVDPPLPLARLRAKNDLLELRAATLRFSVEEASQFLNQIMQLDLPADSIRALDTRTEGWIAGLQLAALAMQSLQGDKQVFVRNFTGSHRFVLDYLIKEVLSQQPEPVRQFLLQTSILPRLNGELCSTVSGQTDGQAMIEHLERNNLFIVPLDQSRYWYRYHHLFADLLQARLYAEQPAALKEFYLRAARWHDQHSYIEDAISYALQARDFEYAAEMMPKPAIGTTRRGDVRILLDWYRAFPPEFVARRPRVSLQFGMAFALNGQWDEAETLLRNVEQADLEQALPRGESLLLSFLVASHRNDMARLDALADEAANAPADRTSKVMLGLLMNVKGDLRFAAQLMAEAQELSERDGDMALALTAIFHQCLFNVFLGNLHRAYDLSQEALRRTTEMGAAALPMATFAHASLGRILIEWNDLDKAADHLQQALQIGELSGFVTGMLSSVTLMLAEVKQARGDNEGATQATQQAMAYAERYDPPAEVQWLKTYVARVWLSQGNLASAIEWMRVAENETLPASLFYPHTIRPVTQARVLLAQRKYEDTISLLTRLLTGPPHLLTVEALLTLALARQAQGDSVHALLMLEQALTLAEAENRLRVCYELGYPLAKLLARFCETHPGHAFAHKLLSALPTQPGSTPPIEPLSERELDVLRLIVAGYSNEEIAQSLIIALSTIKWYVNTLYGKLHVKTRSQAIARTHELKLLAE